MNEEFAFEVPPYTEFRDDNLPKEHLEKYFEIDHEEDGEFHQIDQNEVFHTPMAEIKGFRRSISMGAIDLPRAKSPEAIKDITEGVEKVKIEETNMKRCGLSGVLNNNNRRKVRGNMKRFTSQERLNMLALPKVKNESYMSTAQLIEKYQKGTPERFRSSKSTNFDKKVGLTMAKSPALTAINRHRPVMALSREEREKKEFEEAQKFKIKANPVNRKILKGPLKADPNIFKKPPTEVEPFNLTTSKPKEVMEEPRPDTHFHAQPVPKQIYKSPIVNRVQPKVTKPQTPTFMKNMPQKPKIQRANSDNNVNKNGFKPARTNVCPFSFETRDALMKLRREEREKQEMEKLKKQREFHARPLPKFITNKSNSSSASIASSKSSQKSEENLTSQFKARPAEVLYKEPFVPRKTEKPLTEIQEFNLRSERRLKEREEFNKQMKEKEKLLEEYKRREQELQEKIKEEEAKKIRENAKFTANPIKKYKEVNIQPTYKFTIPKSPNFSRRKLNEDKENVN